MNPLEKSFVNAINCTSQGISQLHVTQSDLITNSLNAHLISLESSFKKEETTSILTDISHIILSQKNPHISSKLSNKQKVILQQMDKVSFCITSVSKLNHIQKTDILDTLYNGDMQQCIDKIINHIKDAKK